jgi:hypothetical protein
MAVDIDTFPRIVDPQDHRLSAQDPNRIADSDRHNFPEVVALSRLGDHNFREVVPIFG